MGKRTRNIAASKRALLLNLAKDFDIDFNRVLLLYMQEKFLSRLSKSEYKDNFLLKGGILMYGEYQTKTRSTKDLDFLADKIQKDPEKIRRAIEDIVTIPNEDGLIFNPQSITIENITDTAQYGGLRVKLEVYLDTAKQILQIDVGFGDVITPSPIKFKFPVLLDNEEIQLTAYSWESVIAEKFEAIVILSDFNSRLKDFYDIQFLQVNKSFTSRNLKEALMDTFKNRGTAISESENIFRYEFKANKDREKQWQAFLRKSQLRRTDTFEDLLNQIEIFILPVIESILNNKDMGTKWDCNKQEWVNK